MSITEKQKHQLKKFIKELEQHRGRHTELVTVYVPFGYDLNKITIRHLLTHTAGLFDHAGSNTYIEKVFADPFHEWTRTEQVQGCVDWGDPLFEPGEQFSYSDTGYILLGEIIENVTGNLTYLL